MLKSLSLAILVTRTWTEKHPTAGCRQTKLLPAQVPSRQHPFEERSVELQLQSIDGREGGPAHIWVGWTPDEWPLSSSSPAGPWSHSLYTLIHPFTDSMLQGGKKRSLARHQKIRSLVKPPTFGLTFHKCAQVDVGTEFPLVTFFLLINNTGTPAAADLSQLSIRDAVSGLTLVNNSGRLLERGFQTFSTDSLSAGSQYLVNYTAVIKGYKNELLALPAYLTFSNTSQNDINLLGPLVANCTLRVTSTEKFYPNHSVHFAGFVGAFLLSALVLCLALPIIARIRAVTRKTLYSRGKEKRC
ncbi:hypothetical protein MATL_G00196350 [Megalops atlanticus]|uniref:Uncharacterized protein n=1 Tax=Megalops atlanticus TaxID=7932 RepID=A0A9D3PJU5_MEGAT|nr:hypothetical protein MATL_G00196350 [Megalops atlanticus]